MSTDANIQAIWKCDSSSSPMGIKKEYVRIGGDLIVGSLLSQIIYWHKPDKLGRSKLRVLRNGHFWVAKTREDWMDECALTEAQYRRAMKVLKSKGLIEVSVMRFNGIAMNHTRLVKERLIEEFAALASPPIEHNGSGEIHSSASDNLSLLDCVDSSHPLTETTAESTAESISCAASSTCAKNGQEYYDKKTVEEKKEEQKAVDEKLRIDAEGKSKTTIGAFWKSLGAVKDGTYRKPLTSKECGQLSKLKRDIGGGTNLSP
jgi:hypothetical protein